MPLSFQPFSATVRPTAFGIYDADEQFRDDANEVIYFVQRMLGTPVLDSELDVRQIWTAFEASTMEYSSMINNHHARNTLLDHLGRPTGTLSGSEGSLPLFNTAEFSRKILIQYAAEASLNSPYPVYTGSVDLVSNVQRYDLLSIISGSGHLSGANAGQLIQIRKVHHYEPTSAYRFFDTTSMMNFMANNMNFASYSPETIFYMLPIWEDVLRGTQLQLNQRVRRSNYSFDINGYELIVYPTPTASRKLFFEWTISRDPLNASVGGIPVHQSRGVTSNISNLAFGHLGYSHINSMGRKWIFDYTLAICKELVGNIRNKYGGLPIPNGNITLNGSDLIAQGQREMENLKQSLRELLDQLSYKNLMQERMEIEDMGVASFKKVPMLIYISR